jgi:hypothetical protein
MSLGVVLVPVSGSTPVIRETAAGLRQLATAVDGIHAQLVDLRSLATWESRAGERFAAALALLPTALDQVRHRYLTAAGALEEFASHHELAAAETERQAVAHRSAHDDVFAAEAEITIAALDPAQTDRLPRLYAVQRDAIARAMAAEEAFFHAWRAFEGAAEECRDRLRAAARDAIVDTGTYDAVHGVRSAAQSMTLAFAVAGTLPTPVKAFSVPAAGVGASVVLAADVLLLVGYGEGSWRSVGETAVWNVAGRGAATMSRAAGIGAVKAANGQWSGQQLRTAERLRLGRAELAEDLARQREALRTPVADRHLYPAVVGGTRAQMIGPQQPLRMRTMRALETSIDTKIMGVNDRWQMAVAGGGNAVVLQSSSTVISTAARLRSGQQHLDTARTTVPPAAERTRRRWEDWFTTRR